MFLKTALFSFSDLSDIEDRIPSGVMMISGKVIEFQSGGILIKAALYFDGRKRKKEGLAQRLFIPLSKIDHIRDLDQ